MLSIFSVLSETVATISLSAPLPSRTTMQFSDNYLNDGHFPSEVPRIDGRHSFNFV